MVATLLLLIGAVVAHIPPSPEELGHLARLQKAHNARARKLEETPDYTCSDGATLSTEKWKVTGTSLGGWLVLEPWLTPSLFYQFLGADERYGPEIEAIKEKTGMDQKSFCKALGPAEANRQLRRHWKGWLTEGHIKRIAATGSTHVRIPIGDYMFKPYGVYDEVEDGVRCNDGAIEELNRALDLCTKYGLGALLDMHAWIGSQNGLDNSGETKFVKWSLTPVSQGQYAPRGTFNHWSYKGWDWIINSSADWGTAMQLINKPHWDHSMTVITSVVDYYGAHPAVWGFSPVNEVGAWTPMDVLRKFYWEAYHIVRKGAPQWIYVMDSSFRGPELGVGGFMKGCPNKAIDKHPYHAWAPWGRIETYYERSCGWASENVETEEAIDIPVIAGEWSLAMDTCAMWLLGFNDMQPGEPRAICDMVPCPCRGGAHSTMDSCYLHDPEADMHPGLPLDVKDGLRGPFGSGISGPMFGRCPREMAIDDNEDEWETTLAHKQISAFNQGHGWFFWNFRTEFEPHWDFLEAWDRGWFPRNVSDFAGLEARDVCGENASPLGPTTAPIVLPPQPGWLKRNWMALLIGAVGGVAVGVLVMVAMAPKISAASEASDSAPYVQMPPATN